MNLLQLLCLIGISACCLAKPLPIVTAGITFYTPGFGPPPDYYYHRPPTVLPPYTFYPPAPQPFGLSYDYGYGYGALSLSPVFF